MTLITIFHFIRQTLEKDTIFYGNIIVESISHQIKPLNSSFHPPDAFRKADLCIALMLANRPFYMKKTLNSLLLYIQNYEPNLKYNLVWIDTVTKQQAELNKELTKAFHFDQKLFFLILHRNEKLKEFQELMSYHLNFVKMIDILCHLKKIFF